MQEYRIELDAVRKAAAGGCRYPRRRASRIMSTGLAAGAPSLLKDGTGYRARRQSHSSTAHKARRDRLGGCRLVIGGAMADGPSGHRRRRLYRLSCRAAATWKAAARRRPRQSERLLRSEAQRGAARRARKFPDFRFDKLDLADRDGMAALFAEHRFPYVVHLAAQAGVRYSLVDPHAYVDANLIGFTNILEGCRHNGCRHLALCVVVVGLRRQHADAVLGARQCRSSA